MKKIVCTLSLLLAISSYSQQVEKPARIDFKFGLPGLFGLNVELVTPILNHKLAMYASYHGFNSNYHHDEVDERVRYFDGGVNYYFKNNGNGFYASLGYGQIFIDASISEVVDTEGNLLLNVYGDFKASTINTKIGVKTRGTLFFRGEIGYGFGNIPKRVTAEGTYNGAKKTSTIERPYYPGMSDSGYVLSTLGIGIPF